MREVKGSQAISRLNTSHANVHKTWGPMWSSWRQTPGSPVRAFQNQKTSCGLTSCRSSATPIGDAELCSLEMLEATPSSDWNDIPTNKTTAAVSAAVSAPDVRMFYRQRMLSGGTDERCNTTEVCARLALPVDADTIFAQVYGGDCLRACFPSLHLEVTVLHAEDENDILHVAGGNLELLRWRRLRGDPHSGRTWLLCPAAGSALPAHQRRFANVSPSRSKSPGRFKSPGFADVFRITDVVFGFVLRPGPGNLGCTLFLYACLPSSGFVVRTALYNLCPGPLWRIVDVLCTMRKSPVPPTIEFPRYPKEEKAATPTAIATKSAPEEKRLRLYGFLAGPHSQTPAPQNVVETGRTPLLLSDIDCGVIETPGANASRKRFDSYFSSSSSVHDPGSDPGLGWRPTTAPNLLITCSSEHLDTHAFHVKGGGTIRRGTTPSIRGYPIAQHRRPRRHMN